MGVDNGAYDTVLVAHVMCVVVGFGGVFLNGLYGAESKRRGGRDGLAVFEATEKVAKVAEGFILAVPVFGIALILMSHDKWAFSQAWVSTALAVYAVALFVSFGLHIPNLRRMGGLMHELVAMSELPAVAGGALPRDDDSPQSVPSGPPQQALELQARSKRAGIYGGLLDLAVVAVVILMVWKPGA